MGMDPVTLSALITAAGAAGGRIFAPQGQKLSSFEGASDLDPRATLEEAKKMLEGVFGGAVKHASDPIDLSDAYVQDLPSYSGGGMPMPIGATGAWGKGKLTAGPGVGSTPFASTTPSGVSTGQTHGPAPGDPDPNNPAPDSGLPGNSPGNGNNPLERSTSLSDGLNAILHPNNGGSGGASFLAGDNVDTPGAPMRLKPTGFGNVAPSTSGTPNSQAIGAVSLLLKLAQAGRSGPSAVSTGGSI